MPRGFLLRDVDESELRPREEKVLTKEEKRKNWWYYNNGKVIAGAIFAVMLFSLLFSIFSKVEPDYTIGLMTSYEMPPHGADELERCITPYADDRNGDGKVVVQVNPYTVGQTDPTNYEQMQKQQASLAQFLVDFSSNDSMIFLHEAESFDAMGDDVSGVFQYNDGTPQPGGAVDYENVMRPWSDFAAFRAFVPMSEDEEEVPSSAYKTAFENLRVSVRSAQEGSSVARSEEAMAYHADSMALYQRLLTGTLPEEQD